MNTPLRTSISLNLDSLEYSRGTRNPLSNQALTPPLLEASPNSSGPQFFDGTFHPKASLCNPPRRRLKGIPARCYCDLHDASALFFCWRRSSTSELHGCAGARPRKLQHAQAAPDHSFPRACLFRHTPGPRARGSNMSAASKCPNCLPPSFFGGFEIRERFITHNGSTCCFLPPTE